LQNAFGSSKVYEAQNEIKTY